MISIKLVTYDNQDFIQLCNLLEKEHLEVIKEQRSPNGNCLNNLDKFKIVFTKFEWFDYRTKFKKLINGHDSKDALRTFVYCTNELGNSEDIIKYIKRELIDESGLYCKENKEEKLIVFLNSKSMKGQIKPDDNVIFYANTGIFSSGKHGFVITDKKIVFSGRKPRVIEYSNLRKLAFDTESDFVDVRLNSSYDTSFGTIDGSKKAHGALAALISAFAFENDPKRDKIIVTSFNDDNDDED